LSFNLFGPWQVLRRGGKVTQKYLLEKAAECARIAEAVTDPIKREMLANLQKLWVNLANESLFAADELAEEIAKVERIHADLMRANFQRSDP
jgi:hypothetical protein